jgi:hypothetical protein
LAPAYRGGGGGGGWAGGGGNDQGLTAVWAIAFTSGLIVLRFEVMVAVRTGKNLPVIGSDSIKRLG